MRNKKTMKKTNKDWTLDLSHYPHRLQTEAIRHAKVESPDDVDARDEDSDVTVQIEDGRLYFIPTNVLQKYRMRRDTGQGLKELWLSNQSIGIVTRKIGTLLNLRTLGLANNRLTSLPEEIGQLKRLERLVLSGNHLSSLPSSMSELASLKELRLDNNEFVEFPDVVCSLRALTHFSITNNKISSLPDDLRKLRRLIELELDNNWLDDEAVGKLPWTVFSNVLQVISLGGRQPITHVPLGIMTLPNIQMIRLPRQTIQPGKYL